MDKIFLLFGEASKKMTFFEGSRVKLEQNRAKCEGNSWQQMEKNVEAKGI
jgi:hypothetical protein